jgi:NAD(P)-dependent dehydrogenase (short-subunit alcohol dehydrogenase family)
MIKQQSGDIINLHLRRVFSGNADWIAYSASKFAVLGLTIPLCKMQKAQCTCHGFDT